MAPGLYEFDVLLEVVLSLVRVIQEQLGRVLRFLFSFSFLFFYGKLSL